MKVIRGPALFGLQTPFHYRSLACLCNARSASIQRPSTTRRTITNESFGASKTRGDQDLTQNIRISGPEIHTGQSAIDKTIGRAYSQRTFVFALKRSDDQSIQDLISILKKAFRECVRQVPILAGTLVAERTPGGSDPYVKSGGGASFIVKDLRRTRSFEALRLNDFHQDDFTSEEWFGIPNWETNPPAESVASLLQVNLVKSGMLVTFCLSHNATDIVGWAAVVRRLAYECRKMQVDEPSPPPDNFTEASFDRAPYNHGVDPSGPAALASRHKGYAYYPAGYDGTVPTGSQWLRQSSARICTMSAEACKALKSHVAQSSSTKCSTHDAVVALIWRSISRAMLKLGRTTSDALAELALPVNTRAINEPRLPNNYVGNAFYITHTALPVRELVDDEPGPLARAAGLIRESIEAVTAERVRDLHRLIDSIPSTAVNKTVQARLTPANYSGPGFFLASHFSLKLQEWDWGPKLGHYPEAYRMTTDTIIPGIPNIFPRTRDGGLEIAMAWDEGIWRILAEDPVWTRYVAQ